VNCVTGEDCRVRNFMTSRAYCLPNVIRVTKARRMRWAELVASTGGQERGRQGFGGET